MKPAGRRAGDSLVNFVDTVTAVLHKPITQKEKKGACPESILRFTEVESSLCRY